MLALVGAVFLSLGAQLQHRGVEMVEERYGSGKKHGPQRRRSCCGSPHARRWVFGSLLLGLAVLFQLSALGFAPLIVVQPLGVVALVITAVLNARVSHGEARLADASGRSGFCVVGIGVFVTVAAFVATEHVITETSAHVILVILVVVLLALGLAFAFFRTPVHGDLLHRLGRRALRLRRDSRQGRHQPAAQRQLRMADAHLRVRARWCAMALGLYFVQTAYSVGSPDLVIAGLTVVDPLVAVSIGIFVLGEASGAPLWALVVWAIAGADRDLRRVPAREASPADAPARAGGRSGRGRRAGSHRRERQSAH